MRDDSAGWCRAPESVGGLVITGQDRGPFKPKILREPMRRPDPVNPWRGAPEPVQQPHF